MFEGDKIYLNAVSPQCWGDTELNAVGGPCACPQNKRDKTPAAGKLNINCQVLAARREKIFMVEGDKICLDGVKTLMLGRYQTKSGYPGRI